MPRVHLAGTREYLLTSDQKMPGSSQPGRRGAARGEQEASRGWKRRMVDKYGQDGFYVHFPLPGTHARRGNAGPREVRRA